MPTPVRSRTSFLVFGAPDIREAEVHEVLDCLRSGWLGSGPRVARFEREFAAYKGVEHAAAVNSCTAALHLGLLACGIGPGDEVITTPLTFCATVNAVLHTGATPVLADVDPRTMNIDPLEVAARRTERTRCILPVHFAGRPCDMDALAALAQRHGLRMIEDCAHAIEADHRGRKTGTIGDVGCFSFYATKNVSTGEGGMVLCREPSRIERVKVLALHGMTKDAWGRFGDAGYKHYDVVEAGFKYNMMDLQAAIGLHQLRRVEAAWKRRREVWNAYLEAFRDLPLGLPAEPEPDTRHALHLFTILIDERRVGLSRDAFLAAMTERRIGVGVHYRSLTEHPYYREHLGWHPDQTPHATRIGRETVSLPLSPALTDGDVEDVVGAVRQILGS